LSERKSAVGGRRGALTMITGIESDGAKFSSSSVHAQQVLDDGRAGPLDFNVLSNSSRWSSRAAMEQ